MVVEILIVILVIEKKYIKIKKLKKITCLCSWQIEKLIGKIDVFINFISFQEMEPEVVKNYIKHVQRLSPKFIFWVET